MRSPARTQEATRRVDGRLSGPRRSRSRPRPGKIASPGFESLRCGHGAIVHELGDRPMPRLEEPFASEHPAPLFGDAASRRAYTQHALARGQIDCVVIGHCDETIRDHIHTALAFT